MERSMDWTLEDNMDDSLFFCATLTGRRGGHTQSHNQLGTPEAPKSFLIGAQIF